MQPALRSHCLQRNISVNCDGALFTVAFSYIVFKDEQNKNNAWLHTRLDGCQNLMSEVLASIVSIVPTGFDCSIFIVFMFNFVHLCSSVFINMSILENLKIAYEVDNPK